MYTRAPSRGDPRARLSQSVGHNPHRQGAHLQQSSFTHPSDPLVRPKQLSHREVQRTGHMQHNGYPPHRSLYDVSADVTRSLDRRSPTQHQQQHTIQYHHGASSMPPSHSQQYQYQQDVQRATQRQQDQRASRSVLEGTRLSYHARDTSTHTATNTTTTTTLSSSTRSTRTPSSSTRTPSSSHTRVRSAGAARSRPASRSRKQGRQLARHKSIDSSRPPSRKQTRAGGRGRAGGVAAWQSSGRSNKNVRRISRKRRGKVSRKAKKRTAKSWAVPAGTDWSRQQDAAPSNISSPMATVQTSPQASANSPGNHSRWGSTAGSAFCSTATYRRQNGMQDGMDDGMQGPLGGSSKLNQVFQSTTSGTTTTTTSGSMDGLGRDADSDAGGGGDEWSEGSEMERGSGSELEQLDEAFDVHASAHSSTERKGTAGHGVPKGISMDAERELRHAIMTKTVHEQVCPVITVCLGQFPLSGPSEARPWPTVYSDYPAYFAPRVCRTPAGSSRAVYDGRRMAEVGPCRVFLPPKSRVFYTFGEKAHVYNCVTNALQRAGMEPLENGPDDADWTILWGRHLPSGAVHRVKPWQKVNHFPGSWALGRKDRLVRTFKDAQRTHGRDEFDFLPESFVMPNDSSLFKLRVDTLSGTAPSIHGRRKKHTRSRSEALSDMLWIIKPSASSCGRGIKVVSSLKAIPSKRKCVVSEYVRSPLLIDRKKFDIRLYVLVTSFNPLRIYIYEEGLVRFCTSTYGNSTKTLKERYRHLTNYSVNKKSGGFVKNQKAFDTQTGSKWALSALWTRLAQHNEHVRTHGRRPRTRTTSGKLTAYSGLDLDFLGPVDIEKVQRDIEDVCIKTIIASRPSVLSKMAGCPRGSFFELFGFDILLDNQLKPWLIEVNVGPSLSSSAPLDKSIKTRLLSDALHVVGVPIVTNDQRSPCPVVAREETAQLLRGQLAVYKRGIVGSALNKLAKRAGGGGGGGGGGGITAIPTVEDCKSHVATMGSDSDQKSMDHSNTVDRGAQQRELMALNDQANKILRRSFTMDGAVAGDAVIGVAKGRVAGGLFVQRLRTPPPDRLARSKLSEAELYVLRECLTEFQRQSSTGFRRLFPTRANARRYDHIVTVGATNIQQLVHRWMLLSAGERERLVA